MLKWARNLHSPLGERLLDWSIFLSVTTPILILSRWMLLRHTAGVPHTPLWLLWISATDILILGSGALFIFLSLGRRVGWPVFFLLFLATLISVIFQSKMRHPLTLGMLSQVGGLLELQTSVENSASSRTILFLLLGVGGFGIGGIGLTALLSRLKKKGSSLVIGLATFFLFGALMLQITRPIQGRELSASLVSDVILSQSSVEDLLNAPFFEGLSPHPLDFDVVPEGVGGNGPRPNVLFIVVESLNHDFITNEETFKKVFPRLYLRKKQLAIFDQHYSVWPFSSNSIYSIVCGNYPPPSTLVLLRIMTKRSHEHCDSWTQSLVQKGYKSWLGYSGDLHYDHMNKFFKAQGFKDLHDRNDFLKRKTYPEMSWGVDDQALVDDFSHWVGQVGKDPWLGFAIPINSHHPWWTPHKEFETQENLFLNSFFYQDFILDQFFEVLKAKGVLKNTIVIITGDHGRGYFEKRNPGTMSEVDFHVPLIISDPTGQFPAGNYHQRTSHVDFKGALRRMTGVGGKYLKGHDLSGAAPVFLLSILDSVNFMLLDPTKSYHLALSDQIIYPGGSWVRDLGETVGGDEELRLKQMFFDYISLSSESLPERIPQ